MIHNKLDKIIATYLKSDGVIRPHSFITGPTGSGKTYTVEAVAQEHGVKMINVNSAQITNEGLAGNSLSKTLVPLKYNSEGPLIVFFDEFDKVLAAQDSCTTNNVQSEVLKILEGEETEVIGEYGKYDRVRTGHVLYFFAGAFNGAHFSHAEQLLDEGLRPELLGRVPLHMHVEQPTLEMLLQAVKSSPLIKEYVHVEGKDHKKSVYDIQTRVSELYERNVIGMRIINALAHEYFIEGGFVDKPIEKRKGFGRPRATNKSALPVIAPAM